jgi:protein gp37
VGDNVKKLEYGIADKAWHPVVGCDPHMPCAPRCWARKTEARTVECLRKDQPERAAFYQIALTPNLRQWSGKVLIDEAHLNDPLKWRKPAIIATGFHGDWGLLSLQDKLRMFHVMLRCPHHRFFPLTKHGLVKHVDFLALHTRLSNVNIGFSVMTQADATAALPHLRRIAEMGWKTHVWHEPAIGPVDWRGWEFLTWLVVGGQSAGTEPFNVQWAYDAITWGRENQVPIKIKQLGSHPVGWNFPNLPDSDVAPLKDRRGADPSDWPEDLRVRQMPNQISA